MKFSLDQGNATTLISAYDTGSLTIGTQRFVDSVIVLPDAVHPWAVTDITDLDSAEIGRVLDYGPDIVLLGTGERQVFPDFAIMALVTQRSIGLEVMDTGAACRTYNILMEEARNVLAALIV